MGHTMNFEDIDQQAFEAFVSVQHSGITNMADTAAVVRYALELHDTEITDEEVRCIRDNYTELSELYSEAKGE